MIYCVKYIVFCLVVLLMIVEWIFQHVQTEIKNKNKNNNNKKKTEKNDRLTQNFEVCYASIRIFSGLKRGSWIWIFRSFSSHWHSALFCPSTILIEKKKKKERKKEKKKKKERKKGGCNPTNQSLRHLKSNTCIMLL